VTYDDELEQDYDSITEADRPPPQGPPPSPAIVDAAWALVRERPRLLGEPWHLYSKVRSQGLSITYDQIRMALSV
jgi:hypothetical protein